MGWIVFWLLIAATGTAGTIASTSSWRFQRMVAREVRAQRAGLGESVPIDRRGPDALPPPVRRYLDAALGDRRLAVRTADLRQRGTFRTSLDGSWVPIAAEQHFTADPPSFIWWGRISMAPGVWVDARDRSVGGIGNMLVKAESTVTLADARGRDLDQGALLRLLGELFWIPTVFLDRRYVGWTAIDDGAAAATLTVGGLSVTGRFDFDDRDLPYRFTADRYRDLGGGRSALTPFVGRSADFRRVDGLLLPHSVVAAWVVDGREIEYARFGVTEVRIGPGNAPVR